MPAAPESLRLVVMGVAGCGKSSVGDAVARELGLPLVEGDDFHLESNREKMRRGVALTDDDRAGWLRRLAKQLHRHPHGLVLTCSALKRSYRDLLREAAPDLRFVWLELPREQARERVAARAAAHFFSPGLLDSQYDTLEPPTGEPGVLRVDALAPVPQLRQQIVGWLRGAS
jgi:gluconokinase